MWFRAPVETLSSRLWMEATGLLRQGSTGHTLRTLPCHSGTPTSLPLFNPTSPPHPLSTQIAIVTPFSTSSPVRPIPWWARLTCCMPERERRCRAGMLWWTQGKMLSGINCGRRHLGERQNSHSGAVWVSRSEWMWRRLSSVIQLCEGSQAHLLTFSVQLKNKDRPRNSPSLVCCAFLQVFF